MITHDRQSKQRKGMVTALVLMVSIILMILGMSMLTLSKHEGVFAVRQAHIISAKAAADSGLASAVYDLKNMMETKSIDLSLLDVSGTSVLNSNTNFDYVVNQDMSGAYQIESTGHSQGVARTVGATLKLKGLFEHAILVKNELYLSPGTDVVAINSSDPFDTDLDVSIGTTSVDPDMVPMGPGTVVNGDVFSGVASEPSAVITGSGTITGEKSALTEELEFPVVNPPSFGITQPELGCYGENMTVTPSDSGRYEEVIIGSAKGSPGKIIISGGQVTLHVLYKFDVKNGCELKILEGASLVLYLDGTFNCGVSSEMRNYNSDAKSFTLFGTGAVGQYFGFRPKSTVFGCIYAPNADVEIWPSSEIHGAFVANDLRMLSNCTFTYDKALQEVSIDDPGARLVLDRWSE